MRLISQTFCALISMTITGTLALGIWWMVQKVCGERYPELVYLLLRITCLLYLVPVVYFLMRATVSGSYVQKDGIWRWDFRLTGVLWSFVLTAGKAWIMFAGCNAVQFVLDLCQDGKALRDTSYPETDPAVLGAFRRVAAKLGIHGKIRLYRNTDLKSPAIGGVFTGRVYLPCKKYAEQELAVAFHHELIHYIQRDRLFCLLGNCVDIIWGVGPIHGVMPGLLAEWSEISCDRKAIGAVSGELKNRTYFDIILDSVEKGADDPGRKCMYPMLSESRNRLERRVAYMKRYEKFHQTAKGVMVLAAFVFVVMSVSTTYAAGVQLSEVHDFIYEKVEVKTEESAEDSSEALEEFYISGDEDDSYERIVFDTLEVEDGIALHLDANEMASFNWTVNPGTRRASVDFYVKSGQTIHIMATTIPNDTVYWIGIMDKWNSVRYVEGTKALSHDFAITSSGNYCVFVQNRGTADITSGGHYYYY